MALIVEDGSIVAGAESYVSVADALTYHTNRGNAAWLAVATDTIREQLLRKATDYMMQMYTERWKGYRKSGAQSLDWPRSFVYAQSYVQAQGLGAYPYLVPDTIVPPEVKNGCSELALRAIGGLLAPDLERQAKQEQVGPISVTYDDASEYYTKFRAIDAMLSQYLNGTPMNMKVERA